MQQYLPKNPGICKQFLRFWILILKQACLPRFQSSPTSPALWVREDYNQYIFALIEISMVHVQRKFMYLYQGYQVRVKSLLCNAVLFSEI